MSIDVRRGRLTRAAVASLAALGLLTGPASQNAHAAPTTPVPQKPGATHTVTLITGDVVRLVDAGGGKQVAEVRRPQRAPGGVRTETIGKDLYVWPDEAMPLIAADSVDRRLFNVSLLVRSGYDDARRAEIPLIATYGRTRAAGQGTAGTTKVRDLPSVNGAALRTAKRTTRDAWDAVKQGNGPQKLWLDGRVKANLKESIAQIGAPEAWAAGYDGKGVKVAVLDTGIDVNHPDLAGLIDGTASFVPGEDVDRRQRARHARRLHDRRHRRRLRRRRQGRRARRRPHRRQGARRRAAPARTPGSSPAWSGRPSPAPTSSA